MISWSKASVCVLQVNNFFCYRTIIIENKGNVPGSLFNISSVAVGCELKDVEPRFLYSTSQQIRIDNH